MTEKGQPVTQADGATDGSVDRGVSWRRRLAHRSE
jgi:hypothetical protein